MMLLSYSVGETLFRIALTFIAYTFYNVVYTLYFHPIAHIPGPRLAAITALYKLNYSYSRSKPLYKKIDELHAKYGSVIRIAPNEIHLSNPDNYEKIYCVGSKYKKHMKFYDTFGSSIFGTESDEVHRIRRGAIGPMFSRKMVLNLEYVIQERAHKLAEKVRVGFESGQSIDLFHGFRAVSIDVITDFAFDKCYNLLDLPDFGEDFFATVQKSSSAFWMLEQWPILRTTLFSIPGSWIQRWDLGMKKMTEFRQHARNLALEVKDKKDAGLLNEESKPTIFHRLLTPGIVPGYTARSVQDLGDEAYVILGAAADTTGNTLTHTTYQVVNNPEIYKRLTTELEEAFPDPNAELDFASLEKLPYLTNVIKEGLRLSVSVPGRLPRVVPESGAVFDGITVAPGTIVAMSAWALHHNSTYFPSPSIFNPDRWSNLEQSRIMEKAFIPFSKGSRACVGLNLAYSELYIALGTLFRRFPNMQGNVLTEKDMAIIDYLAAYYAPEATKFHVSARA